MKEYLQQRRQGQAPWPDFAGNDIYDGDVIEHPSGERGAIIVVKDDAEKAKNYEWKVNYDDGSILWLGNQIGDKGQAVVVHNAELRRAANEL